MTNEMLEVKMDLNGSLFTIKSEKNEGSLWEQVGSLMYQAGFPIPADITLSSEGKTAKVSITKPEVQLAKEDKVLIQLVEDTFYLPKSRYEKRLLRRIDKERDIRSRYDMRPNSMGNITINIGALAGEIGRKGFDRLEDGNVHHPFPSQLFWLRYYEKIASGYKDYTEDLIDDEEEDRITRFFTEPSEEELTDDDVQELYMLLTGAAKDNLLKSGIELDFYSDECPYNARQVKSARKLYLQMCGVNFASEMNELLEDFVAIAAPKYQKGTTVNDFMVKIVKDPDKQMELMGEKLEWVNSIVSSMETVVSMKSSSSKKDASVESPFGDVKMRKLTDEEMKAYIAEKNPEIDSRQRGNIISIYDVKPTSQLEKYEKYLNEESFGKKETLLFHGSPTCNWVSIILNSLMLNPNAQICGKAFGNGVYFAPSSDKSAGYMSNRGSRWRSGGDDVVVMGVYRVATGNPYHGTDIIGGAPEKTKELLEMFQKKQYDCFWYKANSGSFVRDEVIVYNEAACVLDKLIVMKAS